MNAVTDPLRDALSECEAYFEKHTDAEFYENGVLTKGNARERRLLVAVQAALGTPRIASDEMVGRVARKLCRVFDRQEREDGRLGGALVAYNAGSMARPFWDKMARAALAAMEPSHD